MAGQSSSSGLEPCSAARRPATPYPDLSAPSFISPPPHHPTMSPRDHNSTAASGLHRHSKSLPSGCCRAPCCFISLECRPRGCAKSVGTKCKLVMRCFKSCKCLRNLLFRVVQRAAENASQRASGRRHGRHWKSLHQSGALSSGMFCVSKCPELGRKKEET